MCKKMRRERERLASSTSLRIATATADTPAHSHYSTQPPHELPHLPLLLVFPLPIRIFSRLPSSTNPSRWPGVAVQPQTQTSSQTSPALDSSTRLGSSLLPHSLGSSSGGGGADFDKGGCRVVEAFKRVDRKYYVVDKGDAYLDSPSYIGSAFLPFSLPRAKLISSSYSHGATISAPHMHAQ